MEAAHEIRQAVAQVALLRAATVADARLGESVGRVKRLQARRFAGTYADLMASGPYAAAARFFLDELYSDRDFAERDAQFARIAGAIERLFPSQVAATAVALARLHALTEDLDQAVAARWGSADPADASDELRYIVAWRRVARRADRERQLSEVLGIGREMTRLTRTPGLRLMLRMMRAPASAAGLQSLQQFLEVGFDTFAGMSRLGSAERFLETVAQREASLIRVLFDAQESDCERELAQTLGQAP